MDANHLEAKERLLVKTAIERAESIAATLTDLARTLKKYGVTPGNEACRVGDDAARLDMVLAQLALLADLKRN